jgi:hypothetical protein
MTETPIQRHNRLLCVRLLREHQRALAGYCRTHGKFINPSCDTCQLMARWRVTVGVGYGSKTTQSKNAPHQL